MTETANNPDPAVSHVADTALWVAVHRATESKRKDALFRDPYAEQLAGERGKEIVGRLEPDQGAAWSIITRTAVLDELIMEAVRAGADTVLNLAAGLDTRPYRLPLPAATRWIEVDFPEILAYKESKLGEARPQCALERVALDLTDRPGRQGLFRRVNEESRQVLVITEGLLIYLTLDEVAALARDLHAMPHFQGWTADVLSQELLAWLLERQFKTFATGTVRMHFAPPGGVAYFERFGWRARTVRKMTTESRRLKRQMPRAWLYRLLGSLSPKHVRERYGKLESYLLLLERV
jgi:methyltransferase (TIGR00027 family)